MERGLKDALCGCSTDSAFQEELIACFRGNWRISKVFTEVWAGLRETGTARDPKSDNSDEVPYAQAENVSKRPRIRTCQDLWLRDLWSQAESCCCQPEGTGYK